MSNEFIEKWKSWKDYKGNPLIKPRPPDWIIADPTFVNNKNSPDGLWHLFAHSIIAGIRHFISSNGFDWIDSNHQSFSGMRPFLFNEDDKFYLFYEKLMTPFSSSRIEMRESSDLFEWSSPKIIIKPTMSWEGRAPATNSNPCIVKYGDKYRLYYSAGSVFLKDCLFNEPKYIGVAESDKIDTTYQKLFNKPIIIPNKSHPFRNLGAGAIKVLFLKKRKIWLGFNNGIYIDNSSRTRSSILLLKSSDGLIWEDCFDKPIIFPTRGWKRAFVYQLDVRKIEEDNEYWLYYNSRDHWFFGVERIGLSILNTKIP